ncbi:MAG TPA: SRPBCC family protein [Thermoleophilaceae bacterium]
MLHALSRDQLLPAEPGEVFDFFADAHNLEAITPPWLGFQVITPGPVGMGVGTRIDYRLRLHGVPIHWRTRIEIWEPGRRFVDAQERGPYALWHHTHSFEKRGGETLMRDVVRYAVPFGALGEVARRLLVERDLERIFDYRAAAVARNFTK